MHGKLLNFFLSIRMVLESQCAFSTRLDIASDKDAGLLDLRQTEKEVCCPLRDVKSCDPDGFRYISRKKCLFVL